MPDPAEAEELVREDVRQGVGRLLNPDVDVDLPGFRVLEPFVGDPLSNADTGTVAVPWAWVGRHQSRPDGAPGTEEDVMGYLPTNRIVEVRGITVVRDGPDGPAFSRFVDWVSVMAQIGVTLASRPIEFAEPPDV